MDKNIILCSDGTGNAGGNGDVSNVWRIYNAIHLQPSDNKTVQVAMHDDGVGTNSYMFFKAMGGAFGYGLKRNVRDLYHFLIRNYDPNDNNQIYIFGFSRGAYTARVLTGLISKVGVIDPADKSDAEINAQIHQAYEILTQSILEEAPGRAFIGKAMAKAMRFVKRIKLIDLEEFKKNNCHPIEDTNADGTPQFLIRFLGVWDTVPAYGFPVESMADFWNDYIYPYKFSDSSLHPRVRKAVHALAIDEERRTFRPMLFDESNEHENGLPSDRIEQVWFPGVHANIGGGYPKDGLAYNSLSWMMEKAEQPIDGKEGLIFIDALKTEYSARANPSAKIYDSRAGVAVFYRYQPRNIEALSAGQGVEHRDDVPTSGVKLHTSALQRIMARTESYAPGNIPPESKLIGDDRSGRLGKILKAFEEDKPDSASRFHKSDGAISFISKLQNLKYLMLLLPLVIYGKNELHKLADKKEWFALQDWTSQCEDGWLLGTGDTVRKALPSEGTTTFIFNNLIEPTLNCNWAVLTLGLSGSALWLFGWLARKYITKNNSAFWNAYLKKSLGPDSPSATATDT